MNDTAIVPYRTSALVQIEPVDIALIPDCGREEISRVKESISAVYKEIDALKRVAFDKIAKTYLRYTRGLLALIVVVGLVTGIATATVIAAILGGGFIAAYLPPLIIASFKVDREDLDGVPAKLNEIRLLEVRLDALKSREQLTGLGAQADRLASDAGKFNESLARLDDINCSQRERELIWEGRHRLLERITRFRHEVTDEPEAPLRQLTEVSTT